MTPPCRLLESAVKTPLEKSSRHKKYNSLTKQTLTDMVASRVKQYKPLYEYQSHKIAKYEFTYQQLNSHVKISSRNFLVFTSRYKHRITRLTNEEVSSIA